MRSTSIKGFMDIGTNSIMILVVKYYKNSLGTIAFQDKEVTPLGRELYSRGKIGKSTLEKCRLITDRFTAAALQMGADEVIGYATCAAREAENKVELINALESQGMNMKIISGREEARLIELGVFGVDGPKEKTLLLDVGGGSTETILSDGKDNLYMDSLDIGAVRYSYGLGTDPNKPMSDDDYDMIKRKTEVASYRAVRKIKELGFKKVVGSAGTITNLAEICAARRDGDSSYVTYDEVKGLMSELRGMTSEERKKVPKINAYRADIIVGGGAAVESLMELFGVDRMDVCKRGLKEGMQVDHLIKTGEIKFDVRTSSVSSLANRCMYDIQHAEEVRNRSLQLFDLMKNNRMHSMDGNSRKLLEYACMLHDIGEFINYTKHNNHSYTIISNSEMLGFDGEEVDSMALMAKFHHKKFPDLRDKDLRGMRKKLARETLESAMMLKMADIMDRHRTRSVKDVELNVSKGVAELTLISDDDIRMEVWSLRSVSSDFKKVFGLDLKVGYKNIGNSP